MMKTTVTNDNVKTDTRVNSTTVYAPDSSISIAPGNIAATRTLDKSVDTMNLMIDLVMDEI